MSLQPFTKSAMETEVGVAVITHFAKEHLPHCLPPLLNSKLRPRVLVVNSSSQDGTVECALELGAEVMVIPRREFNHGTTREWARKKLNTKIVAMVTPDAYAADDMLEKLVLPIQKKQASLAYARQIPHDGADFFERFPREYNYPKESHIRSIEDAGKWGAYTNFCSNSASAYLNAALDEIGGFPHLLLGEDAYACARLLLAGKSVAYVADAVVKHSHTYTLKQEFQRAFDTGLGRKELQSVLKYAGKDIKRGQQYTKSLMQALWKENPSQIPYALLQTSVKALGYLIGRRSTRAPTKFKKLCTSQDFFFSS
ncbi:MAG: glycosyltransferase [Waddliaceae bacterium]